MIPLRSYTGALSALEQKDYDRAVALLGGALAVTPDDMKLLITRASAHRQRGACHLALADLEDASFSYFASMALDPASATRELFDATAASERREPFQLVRQRALVQNDLALACIEGGKHDDAVTLLNQAIEAETRLHASGQSANGVDYRFFINRGDCFQALGRLEHAIADFHRAYDANPADWAIKTRLSMIHHAMGAQLFNNGEFHAAEIELSTAIQYNGRVAAFFAARGRALFYQHKFDAAHADYRAALALDPSLDDVRTLIQQFEPLPDDRAPPPPLPAAPAAAAPDDRAAAAAPAAPSRSMTRTGFPPLTSLRTVAPELARALPAQAKAKKAQRAIARLQVTRPPIQKDEALWTIMKKPQPPHPRGL